MEGGLIIDKVEAEAAARPAQQLPSQYAVRGIIDPQSPLFSEEPGVLLPLAQAQTPVGDWLAAVDAAGPGTPLSDPMFAGTVFIPQNEAFEDVYPAMRAAKLQGRASGDALVNISTADLTLQLNCLTVPGAALKEQELWPGRLLRTAGLGAIKVLTTRSDNKPAKLQHQPSGVYFSILEADLQSGRAVAHVIDVLPPASVLNKAAAAHAPQETLRFSSAMTAITDQQLQLRPFAWFVEHAESEGCSLMTLLQSTTDAFTLFAPNEQAMLALMASLPVVARQQLLMNASLADLFVSSHLVLGMALGSKALEGLLPGGQLRTPQGNMAVSSGLGGPHPHQLPIGAAAIMEAATASNTATAAAAEGSPNPPGASNLTVATPQSTPAAAAAPGLQLPADGRSAETPASQPHLQPQPQQQQQQQPPEHAPEAGTARVPPEGSAKPLAAAMISPSAAAAAGSAAAVSGDVGQPAPAATPVLHSRPLRVADADVVERDIIGGKAVVHVVDRVLISPALGQALGLPANTGYSRLETPTAAAGGSSSRSAAAAAVTPRGFLLLTAAAAAAFVVMQ